MTVYRFSRTSKNVNMKETVYFNRELSSVNVIQMNYNVENNEIKAFPTKIDFSEFKKLLSRWC